MKSDHKHSWRSIAMLITLLLLLLMSVAEAQDTSKFIYRPAPLPDCQPTGLLFSFIDLASGEAHVRFTHDFVHWSDAGVGHIQPRTGIGVCDNGYYGQSILTWISNNEELQVRKGTYGQFISREPNTSLALPASTPKAAYHRATDSWFLCFINRVTNQFEIHRYDAATSRLVRGDLAPDMSDYNRDVPVVPAPSIAINGDQIVVAAGTGRVFLGHIYNCTSPGQPELVWIDWYNIYDLDLGGTRVALTVDPCTGLYYLALRKPYSSGQLIATDLVVYSSYDAGHASSWERIGSPGDQQQGSLPNRPDAIVEIAAPGDGTIWAIAIGDNENYEAWNYDQGNWTDISNSLTEIFGGLSPKWTTSTLTTIGMRYYEVQGKLRVMPSQYPTTSP